MSQIRRPTTLRFVDAKRLQIILDSSHQTAVRFEHSPDLPSILQHLNASLIITTYQAGQVVVVGAVQGKLSFSFHRFDQPIGVAVGRDQIAI